MEEEFENNDSLINNFQEELKNSKDDFKQEENYLDDDIFQYTPNIREIAKKDFSKYINKQLTPNNNNKNDLVNNLNFKYSNDYNVNEDISGISLLKELEDQWNNIEKQKLILLIKIIKMMKVLIVIQKVIIISTNLNTLLKWLK